MAVAVYYDMRTGFDKFVPYLDSPIFKAFLNIWEYEANRTFSSKGKRPLMEIIAEELHEAGADLTNEEEEEIQAIISYANAHGKNDASWYCALHDCYPLNYLVTPALVHLAFGIPFGNLYVVQLHFDDGLLHDILSTKNFNIDESVSIVFGVENATFYDLIFPCFTQIYGAELCNKAIVQRSKPLTEYFTSEEFVFEKEPILAEMFKKYIDEGAESRRKHLEERKFFLKQLDDARKVLE